MKNNIYIYLCILFLIFFSACSKELAHKETDVSNDLIEIVEQDIILDETVENVGYIAKERERLKNHENSELITGFWNSGFPVSDGLGGYYFSELGFFIYFDYSDISNIKARYSGSLGLWYSDNQKVFITIDNNYYWENDYIETPFGYTVKKDNFLNQIEGDKIWTEICDIKNIKSESGIPDYLNFQILENSILSQKEYNLFHIFSKEDIKLDNLELNEMEAIELFKYTFSIING